MINTRFKKMKNMERALRRLLTNNEQDSDGYDIVRKEMLELSNEIIRNDLHKLDLRQLQFMTYVANRYRPVAPHVFLLKCAIAFEPILKIQ